jgi:integrase
MRGSIRRRGRSWTVTYDEGFDEHGRRRQRSKAGFATRAEAQRFLTDALSRLDGGTYAAPSKTTVRDYLEAEWLPAVTGTVRPLSLEKYRSIVKLRILPTLGHLRLQALTGAHLTALYRELGEAGLSASTIRLTHAVLHRALRDAVRWGRLVRNPADSADPPAATRSRAQAWSPRDLALFLAHTREDVNFPLWRTAAMTGARRGEILGLTWRALDLDGPSLSRAAARPHAWRSDVRSAEVGAVAKNDRARRGNGRRSSRAPRGAATRARLRRTCVRRPRPRVR